MMNEVNLIKHYAEDIKKCGQLIDKDIAKRRLKLIFAKIAKWQERADTLIELIQKHEEQGHKVRAFLLKIVLKIVIYVARFLIRISIIVFDLFNRSKKMSPNEMKQAVEGIENAAKGVRQVEEKSGISSVKVDDVINNVIKAADNLKTQLQKESRSSYAVKNYTQNIDTLIGGLKASADLTKLAPRDEIEQFKKYMDKFSKVLNEVADNIPEAVEKIEQGIDPVEARLKELGIRF